MTEYSFKITLQIVRMPISYLLNSKALPIDRSLQNLSGMFLRTHRNIWKGVITGDYPKLTQCTGVERSYGEGVVIRVSVCFTE